MRRRRGPMETSEYIEDFLIRIIRRAGVRVSEGDGTDLAALVRARHELEEAEAKAVQAMRDRYGYSWAYIGRELGITRQSAEQRYNKRIRALAS